MRHPNDGEEVMPEFTHWAALRLTEGDAISGSESTARSNEHRVKAMFRVLKPNRQV